MLSRFAWAQKTALSLALTLALTGLAGVLIIGKGVTNADGYLTQDSANYLALAENILAGEGFTRTNTGIGEAKKIHFAIWPVGYSTLIAATSQISGLSTFMASKLLNFSLLLLSVLAVSRSFGRDGPIVALALLSAGTIETFAFTWSEAPFIALLTLFAIALAKFVARGETPANLLTGALAVLAISLFLVRYIGIFAIAPMMVVAGVQYTRRNFAAALRLSIVTALTIVTAFAYLAYNKIAVGYATGQDRPPAQETTLEFVGALALALFREIVLPIPYWVAGEFSHNVILAIVLVCLALLVLMAVRTPPQRPDDRHQTLVLSFLLVGFIYLGAIIAARWSSQFDPFGFRLLSPGTTIIFIGLLAGFLRRYPEVRLPVHAVMLLMVTLSLLVHAKMLDTNRSLGGYAAPLAARGQAYDRLPEGAIVLFGNRHLRYQRPDVHVNLNGLRARTAAESAQFNAFMSRLDHTRPIFVEMNRWAVDDDQQHPTTRAFIESCDPAFYLSEIRFDAGDWRCIPFAQIPSPY